MTRIECKNPAFHLVLQTFIWHACLDVVVLWVLQPTWMSCCMSNRYHCAMERCNRWRLCTAGYKSHLLDPHIQEGAFKPIYGQTNVWNCQENHLCIQVFHNWWKKPEKISPTCVNQSWGHYNTSIVKHLQEFDKVLCSAFTHSDSTGSEPDRRFWYKCTCNKNTLWTVLLSICLSAWSNTE